jgi:hypothetical protein
LPQYDEHYAPTDAAEEGGGVYSES